MTAMALKYLRFADVRQKIWERYDVSSKERQILRLIAQAFFQGAPLRVSKLLDMSAVASPATVHKAMRSLMAKDLLQVRSGQIRLTAELNTLHRPSAPLSFLLTLVKKCSR